MTKDSKPSDNPAADPNAYDMMRVLQASGFGSMTTMGTAWVEAMSDLGSEFLSFVADRVKEDVQAQHEILHAKDVEEVQKLQAKFIKKAVDQYSAETGKMVALSHSALAKIPGGIIIAD